MIEDSNRTDTVVYHMALTAVTAVDIGTIHAFLGGGAVLSGNRKPTLHYIALALPRPRQLFTGFEPRTLHVGSQFGPCGFCGEPSGIGIVLLSPPVGVIPPMATFSTYLYSALARRTSGRILEAKQYPSLL